MPTTLWFMNSTVVILVPHLIGSHSVLHFFKQILHRLLISQIPKNASSCIRKSTFLLLTVFTFQPINIWQLCNNVNILVIQWEIRSSAYILNVIIILLSVTFWKIYCRWSYCILIKNKAHMFVVKMFNNNFQFKQCYKQKHLHPGILGVGDQVHISAAPVVGQFRYKIFHLGEQMDFLSTWTDSSSNSPKTKQEKKFTPILTIHQLLDQFPISAWQNPFLKTLCRNRKLDNTCSKSCNDR